ncbi:response regulator receiver modulated diguanylate cyclase [Novosphingobium sp. MBES04]|nr:diguanylate cyclase [Novosphingobium sp. MBES04]GAM06049.1 response regulator receiver modulated diguanylate cyclase [Novosphingobium sp. MBES04]
MEHDILTIDGDPIMTQILIEQLAPLTRPRVAANASEAMKQIARRVPDLILLDTELPGTHGIDLCRALHSDARLAHVPIIFITAQTGENFEIEGLESGAVDFISKPPRGAVLRARVKTQLELARLTRELELLNLTDPLTGLINRRRYDEVLHNELARARRSREPLSLILVDLDDFKLFNDQYGHGAGDECLCKVAQLLQTCARRPADAVARIGGEELA